MDGCDRISDLPESLLTQILSHLPTKVSVKTSLLSKRWESVWLRVPGLELTLDDFRDGQALESFVNKFLEFNEESRMQKFKIQSKQCNDDRLVEWIDTAVARGVQELYVETINAPYATQDIYRSNTLNSLKLLCVGLKIMHIEDVWYDYDPLIIENIISGFLALEELTMISRKTMSAGLFSLIVENNTRVRSQTLKRFRLIFENTWGGTNFSFEIDAPRLEYLSVRDHQSDEVMVKNLSSLLMVDIDTNLAVTFGSILILSSKIDTIQDFFAGISGVKYMIISHSTLEDFEAFVLLPVELELSYVPWCLISTLERVYINKLIMKEESGIKLVNYFLENSAVLKELTGSFFNSPLTNEEREIFKILLTSSKRSSICQVSIY